MKFKKHAFDYYYNQISSDRKKAKYHALTSDLTPAFSNIKFINPSMSTLGLLGKSSDSLLLFLEDLKFDKPSSKYIIKKIMNIAIRCSYYIFCLRNRPWTNPAFFRIIVIAYYCYFFIFLFRICTIFRSISSSSCCFYPFVVFSFVFFDT